MSLRPNRSKVVEAFNSVEARSGKEVADALLELARIIAGSGNLPGEAVFESFRKEAAKPEPEKGALKKLWDGLLVVMDGVGGIVELGLKLAPLWT